MRHTPLGSRNTTAVSRGLVLAALTAALGLTAHAQTGTSASSPTASSPVSNPTVLCPGSEPPRASSFDAATRTDAAFNAAFRHCFRTVNGVQMHYVVGGIGKPLVLLHGWPQSWFEWRGLLPELAKYRTVMALDLPGLGDSTGSPPSFEKAVLAGYVRGLVKQVFGAGPVDMAAHDLGAGVAWAYARANPAGVRRLAALDFPLPSPNCTFAMLEGLSYHFSFFNEPKIPELLIGDKVEAFLGRFYPHVTPNKGSIKPDEVREYARTYARPANLHGGFELYRTLAKDQAANTRTASSPLKVPLLVLTEDGGTAFDAYGFESGCYRSAGATQISGQTIKGAGHWLNEEAPGAVLSAFGKFFGW